MHSITMASKNSPSCEPKTSGLKVRQICQIEPMPKEQLWLVEDLWLKSGVGFLCGHPKSCKTFLAAQLATSVASGKPLFGKPVKDSGPVLFYGAEDSLPALRTRFDGICRAYELCPNALPLFLIDAPVLRLDQDQELRRLRHTLDDIKPRLLVLDPLIRLARIDENSSAEVSTFLASLRAVQRDYDLAILLTHHARKSAASHPSSAFRGSSDLGAWSDSNLFLLRKPQHLKLIVEHRSAAAPDPLDLQLNLNLAPHLIVVTPALTTCAKKTITSEDILEKNIIHCLALSPCALTTTALQKSLKKRKITLVQTLRTLADKGHIKHTPNGWVLTTIEPSTTTVFPSNVDDTH